MIRRRFVTVRAGTVHVAASGDEGAPAVLLLHQTPRSWREYAGVLPLLADRFHALAMDTMGFGDSDRLAGAPTIERWADAAGSLLDALGIDRAHVVGHHTGGVIAVELAAARPELVDHLVLSSTPFADAAFRAARAANDPIDHVEAADDGSHLAALWQKRQGFYPAGRPELLHAFVADAMTVLDDLEGGHTAVATYRMEDRIGEVTAPTLVLRATDDPFAFPHGEELRRALVSAATVELADVDGGMVPLPDQLPDRFAAAILDFLPPPGPAA